MAGPRALPARHVSGSALGDRATPGEQRLQNAQTSRQMLTFLRYLPADRFPVLAAIGEQVWTSDRDERSTASINAIISGLISAQDPLQRAAGEWPAQS
ncbi:MAG TPA: hypothetical protein VMA73_25325 [Streptosporangiaceae bacterium]|nr:hypothetical protein [Streptosporangiaceae bacterium]